MRNLALLSAVVLLSACERVDYIEIAPSEVVFKQPNNQVWLEAKCMARNGVRAVKARVSWTVKDESVAKVNDKGNLTPVGDGDTEVIAKYENVEARIPVQVVYVDRIEVEPKQLTIKDTAEPAKLTVKAFRKNGKPITDRTVTLTAADKKIVQVVADNGLMPLDPGTTTVDVQVDGARASVQVTVEEDKTKK
ncbi:MAG: Ig-like domain-containing protein [Myxococcota bacterium]